MLGPPLYSALRMAKAWLLREHSPTARKAVVTNLQTGHGLHELYTHRYKPCIVDYFEMHFYAQVKVVHNLYTYIYIWLMSSAWTVDVYKCTRMEIFGNLKCSSRPPEVHKTCKTWPPILRKKCTRSTGKVWECSRTFRCCVSMWGGVHMHIVEGKNLGKKVFKIIWSDREFDPILREVQWAQNRMHLVTGNNRPYYHRQS